MPGLPFLAQVVIAYAFQIVSKASQASSSNKGLDALKDTSPITGIKANTRDTQETIKVTYGQNLIGGNDVFIEATGTDNKDLWVVQTLAEGECDSIAQVSSIDQVFAEAKLYTEYGGNMSYWFHSGSSSQTYDTNLNTAISKWTDNLRNTCYIVYKLTFDRDYFSNLPTRTVLLKGKKLYDFRDTTTAWSDNPVLALYDYMTNSRYGMGKDSSVLDTTSWTSAANYCDTKSWNLNLVIREQDNSQDIINNIVAHFRGHLVWYDGKFYLRYADLNYESSVMTITDSHIVQSQDGKANLTIGQPGKFGKPEAINIKWVDPDKDYNIDDIVIGDSLGVVNSQYLLGCNNRAQATALGSYYLERQILDRSISGMFRDDALKLEAHDVITFNSTALGISDQLMRVSEAAIQPNGQISLSLMYENSALYDDDYDVDIEGTYTCSLPDKNATIPAVGNVVLSETTYDYRLQTFTRLNVTFDSPADYPWFSHIEVWRSFDDETYENIFPTDNDFAIDPVEEGALYYLRLKTVNIFGAKTSDSNDIKVSRTIGGYTSAPTSLTALNAIVNASTVSLYSTKVSSPDVELYEFRLGASWNGAVFMGSFRSPNLNLYGTKPGSHTFFCNTLSNNGIYGSSPVSASAVLSDPPQSWAVTNTETCDYNAIGTHDNTEHVTYASTDYLKCSHTADVLTGTYTSPIYDRGASAEYLVYVLAAIAVTGTGTTWDVPFPTPNTWDDGDVSRFWREIFEPNAAPSVTMKLLYGDASPPTNEVEQMEIMSAIVTARYYQVEITITDPSTEINALVEHFTLKFCQ